MKKIGLILILLALLAFNVSAYQTVVTLNITSITGTADGVLQLGINSYYACCTLSANGYGGTFKQPLTNLGTGATLHVGDSLSALVDLEKGVGYQFYVIEGGIPGSGYVFSFPFVAS